jgi:PPIC-type PPIASE domain
VCVLLAGLACRHSAQSATPELPAVGPDDPVITLQGFCAGAAQPRAACKTVITRAQFEKLAEALDPGMSVALRLKVANAYARNLRMSAAAEKRGLDKTPAFDQEMRFARMQLLAQDLVRVLQAEANDISDADLQGYYQKNQQSFEEATLARIFVPHSKQIGGETSAEAMTTVAAELRARAVSGEDPDSLQLAAYAQAGIARTTSGTKLEKVRRSTLPPAHETVLDLKPGEVSAVFSDPAGAHFIYKMLSKRTLTLEEAKAETRGMIYSQRYRDSLKSVQGDTVFSDAYFNPPGRAAVPAGPAP